MVYKTANVQWDTRMTGATLGEKLMGALRRTVTGESLFLTYFRAMGAGEVAYHREYRSMVGSRDGVPIGACSTGIGCPSAAIAAEELINVGVKTLIRVGSTAALQPHIKTGDLIVSTGAMKNESRWRGGTFECSCSAPSWAT